MYRGSSFPAEMQGSLFSAMHNSRKIVRHRLKPPGSTYTSEDQDFITAEDPDVHFSDVLEDHDGTLLLVDTGSWYIHHCPTGRIRQSPARGGIYRVSFGQPKPRVWTAATPERSNLQSALTAGKEADIGAAVRDLGRQGDSSAARELTPLLGSPSQHIRLAAVEALAHCGQADTVPTLIEALTHDPDPHLQHALTFALYRLASPTTLLSALDHLHPKVQRAALVLLDQPPLSGPPAQAVTARLFANDPQLRETARWVLQRHPNWSAAGAGFLAQILETNNPSEEDLRALHRFLPLFQTNATVVSLVADLLAPDNNRLQDASRLHLVQAISQLRLPTLPSAWSAALVRLLRQGAYPVRSPALRIAGALRISGGAEALRELLRDPLPPLTLRIEAARELLRYRPVLEQAEFDFLQNQLTSTNPAPIRLAVAETLAAAKMDPEQLSSFLTAVRGDPLISPLTLIHAWTRGGQPATATIPLLDCLAVNLDAGWTIPTEELAKVQARLPPAEQERFARLHGKVTAQLQQQQERLSRFEPLLQGGDPVRGQIVFYQKANCNLCHSVWDIGGRVGPDLSRVGSIRAGRDLLESLVLPSATTAQGYQTLNVSTRDGELYSGIRVEGSGDPLTLRTASGTEVLIRKSQIDQIQPSKVSLMPEGLLDSLTHDEARDLLAYLQGLK
jgi:putative heme-binding domain-containing protein